MAIWLFIAVALLLVLAVALVVLAVRRTIGKGKELAREMDGLSQELDQAIGSGERQHER
ncbi:hypothetical protein [Phytoactinopolyspora halotolerans]|uniref:Uncharacterized protein n=1 Tax=Phytoactinopolyspora halotolerans TaxID=1981512 RepID=A0A6L9SCR4_9ACTN|nr:hypothetical protein [Phytoactinopolyspora halotolerans]NEE03175.1 hypothetical protein [Phytoactinopolyspora halotolerans]